MVHHLGRLLLQLYCHHPCNLLHLSKEGFQICFLNCISGYWKIDYKQMSSKRLVYRAFREDYCSKATFEKMCMFYYARIDKQNSEKIISEYLAIANRQRIELFPYSERFKEEYEAGKKKEVVAKLPKDFVELIDRLSTKDIKKLKQRIRKREEKEKKRK